MNHPFELLADLVDGTLNPGDRARVDAHLEECAACRDDVAAATIGRREARLLPQASPPSDLSQGLGTASAPPGQGAPRWYRWAGVAAAAALVAVIAISLPNVGGDQQREALGGATPDTAAGAESAGVQAASEEVPLQVQDREYGEEDLQLLAKQAGVAGLGAMPTSGGAFDRASSAAAVRCVAGAFQGQPAGRLTRLIQARFNGRQAYLAVYLEGPGAGQPADTGVVYVAAKDDCSLLTLAFAQR